jgi:hypothetical protein
MCLHLSLTIGVQPLTSGSTSLELHPNRSRSSTTKRLAASRGHRVLITSPLIPLFISGLYKSEYLANISVPSDLLRVLKNLLRVSQAERRIAQPLLKFA